MKFPFLFLICAGIMSSALAVPVFAGDAPYRLDQIVVTASRVETPIREAPANVTIVTREAMAEQGATTVADALRPEAGVFTNNILSNPKTSTVDIRGYGENAPQNVLVLVDGRRVNNVDMSGADFSQIPVDMIERIEVYRGPASVLFGDNAVAGVINIITKKGYGKPKITAGVTAGSYGFVRPSLTLSGGDERFSYLAQTSSLDTDGYRHNNGFHGRDAGGNFSFAPLENLTFTMRAGHHKDRYGLPGSLTSQQMRMGIYDRKDSATPLDDARTEDNFVDLGADVTLWRGTVFSLNGSYRDRNSSSHWETFAWDTKRNLTTYGFTPKLTVTRETGRLKNVFTGGFDYYRSPTRSDDVSPAGVWATTIEKRDYSFYANNEVTIANVLLLSAGYRVNKVKYDFDYLDHSGVIDPVRGAINDKKDAFRGSVNYLFKDGNIFLTYAKGFRFPTTDELFNIFTVPPINRLLHPQTTREIDAGLRWNPTKRIGGAVTLFRTKTEDEIYYNPITFTNGNYDRTERRGIEATLSLLPVEGLRFDVSYSYIRALFDGGPFRGNDVPFVPRNKFASKASYLYRDFTLSLIGIYTGNRFAISDPENVYGKVPGFTTFDFTVDYTYRSLKIFFAAQNITDQRYDQFRTVSGQTTYSYPAPGRQFLFGLHYTVGG